MFDRLCVGMSNGRNADRLYWQPYVTLPSDSRIVRVGIAATYWHFRWPAFRSVGIKAVTGCTRECWHSARSFSLARRPFRRPDGSGHIAHCDLCLLFITAPSSLYQRHLIRPDFALSLFTLRQHAQVNPLIWTRCQARPCATRYACRLCLHSRIAVCGGIAMRKSAEHSLFCE